LWAEKFDIPTRDIKGGTEYGLSNSELVKVFSLLFLPFILGLMDEDETDCDVASNTAIEHFMLHILNNCLFIMYRKKELWVASHSFVERVVEKSSGTSE